MRTNAPPSLHQKVADPFFLSSPAAPTGRLLDASRGSGGGDVDRDAADATAATQFGLIRLESRGESDDGYGGAKSKKKKKATRAAVQKQQKIVKSNNEDNNNVPQPKRGVAMSKEIHNLALVDLTTPLGEDEVMPRNEHYVVPERQWPEAKSSPSTKSKKKKDKGDKGGKKKKSRQESAPVEGDLLSFDLMAFRLCWVRCRHCSDYEA